MSKTLFFLYIYMYSVRICRVGPFFRKIACISNNSKVEELKFLVLFKEILP